ncbi:hypothetical protein [Kitasatospora sp. NPDC088783]|uniref:hypothetical protein n=1 Tax=Kitasatospora sp. NPDC088783 TaxID=3364077 RepID=UPI00380A0F46
MIEAPAALRARTACWRGTGGPSDWDQAWDRAVAYLAPAYAQQDPQLLDPDRGRWAEGAAGLALAWYLLAATSATPVAQVPVDDVRALAVPDPGTASAESTVARIDVLFERAGHHLDDADPVAACWRDLRADLSPAQPLPETVQSDWTMRWGPDKVRSLLIVLDRAATAGAR